MKTFTEAAKAALKSGQNIVSGAIEIAMSDGSRFRAWGGHGPLTLGDDVYVGLGDDALVSASGGALGDAAQNVELSLSGVDPEVAAQVDLELLRNAPAVTRRLIFDGSGRTLLDQHVFSRGRVDTADVEETPGGTAVLKAQVESAAKSLGRAGGRMRTDVDQRLVDEADPFFSAVSVAGEKTLYLGGKIPARAGQVANGGQVTGVGGGISISVPRLAD